jgi:hypothetical protein
MTASYRPRRRPADPRYSRPVLIGIDHLVIAVADPDAAAEELERVVGLRATGGGRHDTMGTFNRLVWLGDTYLELIGVWDEALAATSWVGRPTLDALRAGRSFATYAVASDAIDVDVGYFRSLRAAWEGPIDGQRMRRDGRVVRWRNATPGTLGPDLPPFVIEHDSGAAEWTLFDRQERAAEAHPIGGPVRLEVLELAVADVRTVTDRYLRALGLAFRPSLAGRGARDLSIGPQLVRVRRADGPVTVHLHASGTASRLVDVLGLRFAIRG